MNTSLVVSSEQLKASRALAIQKAKATSAAAGEDHGRYIGKFVASASKTTAHQAHKAGAASVSYTSGFGRGFFAAFKAE